MINLTDTNLSYLICSQEHKILSQIDNNARCNRFMNMLWSMNYTVIPIYAYENGSYEKNYLGICAEDNDTLRKEAIFMMNEFSKDDIIVKYKGDDTLSKIVFDGNEIPIDITYYDNSSKKSYIHEGISFTLTDRKKYFFPKQKEDLKSGMIIEYFNNNRWSSKQVTNLELEYDKMYKLLMKYEKIRVQI